MVMGKAVTEFPKDLYIPPQALEVFLEAFEGPLDLLLYLIKRQNLDILEIDVSEITEQYMRYVELMDAMQFELAAEYLLMAAMLAEIKSRMLLPRSSELEEDEEDPRAQLIRRLQEYERFKKAAEEIEEIPRMERDTWAGSANPPDLNRARTDPEVDMRELLVALGEVLRRADMFESHHIQREALSTRERMSQVLEMLAGQQFVPFVALFSAREGRLGVVVTFVTVSISAIRISNINIIAAIRDLNLPNLPRESQWTLFLHPFLVWRAAIAKAGEGNRREALRLFLVAGPKAILSFWGGLLARGPVLLALGYAMAWVGVNVAEQSGVYGLGVSLFLIGLGQLLHWIRLSARLSYSLVGLSLILYWSLPTREVGRLADLNSNPGDFFISGIFLVGGAIILFLYNADSLLNLFAGVLGRMGRLLPVARMSIAYPVNAKGRTATTLAMFSLIIFTLVGTITITNTFSNFLDPESGSGGYDVLVQSNPFNPVSQADLEAQVAALVADGEIAAPEALAAATFAPVTAKSPEMADFAGYAINGVDAQFLATQKLELANIADGYDDPAGVWAAIQSDPTLVVVDNFVIDRSGDPTYQPDEDTFAIRSISAGSVGFAPVDIEIMAASGEAHTFTVIGVLGSAPSFFGALMNSEAAAGLGYDQPNRFFIRVADGEDVRQTANVIEGALSSSGVQTTLMKAQLEQSRDTIRSVFYLIQGFIGLGLLVGVAALGVIMIRSVVERRQQIGVLRAIGFQRSMVQGVFLFEGFFIAGLGTFIGYVLALTFAYNLYLQVAADQGLAFLPPWAGLAAIAVIILAASLVTSWLPARATAKVTIAEALRYE